MGQKINPLGFRLGVTNTWDARWFAPGKKYQEFLGEDLKIRSLLMKKLRPAGVSKIEIERSINKVKVIISVSRPGVLIGRASFGNPWIFKQKEEIKKLSENIEDYRPTLQELKEVINNLWMNWQRVF